jgi:hypothetical protein
VLLLRVQNVPLAAQHECQDATMPRCRLASKLNRCSARQHASHTVKISGIMAH